jgi:hypothetical protein
VPSSASVRAPIWPRTATFVDVVHMMNACPGCGHSDRTSVWRASRREPTVEKYIGTQLDVVNHSFEEPDSSVSLSGEAEDDGAGAGHDNRRELTVEALAAFDGVSAPRLERFRPGEDLGLQALGGIPCDQCDELRLTDACLFPTLQVDLGDDTTQLASIAVVHIHVEDDTTHGFVRVFRPQVFEYETMPEIGDVDEMFHQNLPCLTGGSVNIAAGP